MFSTKKVVSSFPALGIVFLLFLLLSCPLAASGIQPSAKVSFHIQEVKESYVDFNILFEAELPLPSPNLRPVAFYYHPINGGWNGWNVGIMNTYSPGWRLERTNNQTIWVWSLLNSHRWETQMHPLSAPYGLLSFPFESSTLDVLVGTNSSLTFDRHIRLITFGLEAYLDIREMSREEALTPPSPFSSRFDSYYHLVLQVYHSLWYKSMIIAIYMVLATFTIRLCRMLARQKSLREEIRSNLTILGILSGMVITYRTELAPPWFTPIDIIIPVLITLYGILIANILISR